MTQPTIEEMVEFLDNTMQQVDDESYAMRHLQNIRDHLLASQANTLPLDELDTRLREIGGCSNHGCYIVMPVGMGTNGPCHCLDNPHKARSVVRAYQKAIAAAKEGVV